MAAWRATPYYLYIVLQILPTSFIEAIASCSYYTQKNPKVQSQGQCKCYVVTRTNSTSKDEKRRKLGVIELHEAQFLSFPLMSCL